MTTIDDVNVKCSVCDNTVEQTMIMSTSQFGYKDLDTRPSEMYRSTIGMWINECPRCGYVASSVDEELTIDENYLNTEEYKTCDHIDFKSLIAPMFYKQYLIEKKKSEDIEAFYAMLHCAWACDDVGDSSNSKLTRKIAVELVDKIINIPDIKTNGLILMKADLLRRSGEFEELIKQYEDLTLDDEYLNKILRFQVEKARQKDDACYTLKEFS